MLPEYSLFREKTIKRHALSNAEFLAYIGSIKGRRRIKWIVGDKGYDCQRIIDLCLENNLTPVIPKRKKPNGEERDNPNFDKKKYKERNHVERCIGWLKENRRIATRYEKTCCHVQSNASTRRHSTIAESRMKLKTEP